MAVSQLKCSNSKDLQVRYSPWVCAPSLPLCHAHQWPMSHIVLVISATPSEWERHFHGGLLNQRPHLYDPREAWVPIGEKAQESPHGPAYKAIGWYSIAYGHWIHHLSNKDIQAFNQDPWEFLYPWIEYRIHNLHFKMQQLRDAIANQEDGPIDAPNVAAMLTKLKRYLPAMYDLLRSLRTQAHVSFHDHEPTRGLARRLQFGEQKLNDAQDLLKMVGEELQLEATLKSIEGSQRAIQEAISVNRLTSLAFFFLPLGLVASIFSMNLKQLNGSGPDLKYFIITTVTLFVVTMIAWLVIKKVLAWWKTQRLVRESHGLRKCYGVLWQCLFRSQIAWVLRPGVVIGLLTDHVLGDPDAYDTSVRRLARSESTSFGI